MSRPRRSRGKEEEETRSTISITLDNSQGLRARAWASGGGRGNDYNMRGLGKVAQVGKRRLNYQDASWSPRSRNETHISFDMCGFPVGVETLG
jgi:hypothetical protein